MAQDSGYWINFRFDPRLIDEGKNPLQIDTRGEPKITFREFAEAQNRFRQLKRGFPAEYDAVIAEGEQVVRQAPPDDADPIRDYFDRFHFWTSPINGADGVYIYLESLSQ